MRYWPKRQPFWAQIPRRGMTTLLVAVGLTFSTMGFLGDVTSIDRQPFSNAVYGGLTAALTAIAFLLAFARSYVWLLIALAIQVVSGWLLHGPALQPPFAWLTDLTPQTRLKIDSAAALLTLISGYNAFIVFIQGEGRRQVALRTELTLAKEMHQTLVPRIDTTIGRCRFHGVSDPSGQVGGDLVDLVELPDDGWLAYVADVSGHGVSSGLVMGMVKSAVRMAMDDELTVPALTTRLNRLMCAQLKSGTYVTLGAMRGHADGRVDVLTAGHPPLLRTRRETPGIETISTDNIPVGVLPDWTFRWTTIHIEAGDTLVLLTDGLFEVFDKHDRDLGIRCARSGNRTIANADASRRRRARLRTRTVIRRAARRPVASSGGGGPFAVSRRLTCLILRGRAHAGRSPTRSLDTQFWMRQLVPIEKSLALSVSPNPAVTARLWPRPASVITPIVSPNGGATSPPEEKPANETMADHRPPPSVRPAPRL